MGEPCRVLIRPIFMQKSLEKTANCRKTHQENRQNAKKLLGKVEKSLKKSFEKVAKNI